MSHNDINKQIRRVSPEYPIYLNMMPSMNNDNNLVQTIINTKKDFRDFEETYEVLLKKPSVTLTVLDKAGNSDQAIVNSRENIRKGKKVWNNDIDVSEDTLDLDSNISMTNEENIIDNIVIVGATSKAYEVTEDKSTTSENNYTSENEGYLHIPPTDENQNLTSTFYKILSKYNINNEDKLQNYDLSLQRKVQNPMRSVYRDPLPYGYNNLNHLPVDPLLAVFLSNYGFYLPSLYGIRANYNNLYGYLASNNIHNNKPFGLYKVFSDTDSWN